MRKLRHRHGHAGRTSFHLYAEDGFEGQKRKAAADLLREELESLHGRRK